MFRQAAAAFAIVVVAMAGLNASALAQTVNITGTVVDSSNSQAISGASVKILELPQFTTTTAANGTFTLTGTATAARLPEHASSPHETVSLHGNTIAVEGASGLSQVVIDVFACNGARAAHFERVADANGRLSIRNLQRIPGLFYYAVNVDGTRHIISNGGAAIESAASGRSPADRLAKLSSTYTLAVNSANYAGKQIALSGITGDVGTIKLAPLSIQTGVWTNVTPSGINLDPNFHGTVQNYGVNGVTADPVRPGEFYAFACYQGVWKSTDFGVTWNRITATGMMDIGRATGAIDPNPKRDPAKAPTFYGGQLYGIPGLWKSTDGGVNWVNYQTLPQGGGTDLGGLDIDPYDINHIIAGLHEANGINESFDGGVTWHVASNTIVANGISFKPTFINTGDSATTRRTWLAISQVVSGNEGTGRTTDGGATWTKVSNNVGPHGGTQTYQALGIVYMAGVYATEGWGVLRSTDLGITWTHVGSTASETNVFGTPNHAYAMCNGATFSGNDSHFEIGPANGLGTWTSPATPPALSTASNSNGAVAAGVSYDSSIGKYVIVAGCFNQGMWRYMEP